MTGRGAWGPLWGQPPRRQPRGGSGVGFVVARPLPLPPRRGVDFFAWALYFKKAVKARVERVVRDGLIGVSF